MTLFLDANVVIYLVEGATDIHQRAERALEDARRREPGARIAVSRLSWLECRVKPLRDARRELLRRYEAFFSAPDLLTVELAAPVVEAATQLRAILNLSTPDALQAASALHIPGPLCFFSNDRRFERVPGLLAVSI